MIVTVHPNRTVSLSEFSFFKIRDVCMDFKPYFKVHSLVSVRPKAPYYVKWPISTWSFMCWCQLIDWLKFETRPSSLLNFGTANWNHRYWAVIHITAVTLFMKRGNPCIFPVIRERHLANRLIENITCRHTNKVSTFHDKPSSCQGPLPFTCLVYLKVKILYLDWWIGA